MLKEEMYPMDGKLWKMKHDSAHSDNDDNAIKTDKAGRALALVLIT